VAVHCSQYQDPEGGGPCLIYQLHDTTLRHLAESRLNHIAYHDDLTGLANRPSFHERLVAAVARNQREPMHRFAVLYLDLDRFKLVNDSLGHGAGNELLREVAHRLRASVGPTDLVARLGGDEFAVLLEPLTDPQRAFQVAERVLEDMNRPMLLMATQVVPGVSVGITCSDLGQRSADEIMRDADQAMAQLALWKQGRADRQHLCMHVNIWSRDLARASLVPHVEQVLVRHQATPGSLTLELTETMLMGRLDVALRTMASLKAQGVRFSIDDFGTGYSSLSYLGRLPIDSLKIDRSFVMAMQASRQNLEIVRAMLTLGRTLGHSVIAEGVETAEQLATLRELGVHEGQGYLLARPMAADQVGELLAAAQAAEAPAEPREVDCH
jgi:diguanylate cyclase (GGDEF)-like protein